MTSSNRTTLLFNTLSTMILLSPNISNADFVGFGSLTKGAHSCPDVVDYHVTTLDDSGKGSLRDAVSTGCRNIVFDVAGEIVLLQTLGISHPFITIDGLSAPTPGITLVTLGIRTAIEARRSIGPVHDVIIRHIRVRGSGEPIETRDIWEMDGESHPVYNIVIDHVSASASSDGVFDMWGNVHDVTISNNLITDTLLAGHLSHESTLRQRISFYGNVYARNNERQVKFRYNNDTIEFINNVVYGWGWMEAGASGLRIVTDSGYKTSINVIRNIFHYTSEAPHGRPNDAIDIVDGIPDIYFFENSLPTGETDGLSTIAKLSIPADFSVPELTTMEVSDQLVPCAGPRFQTDGERNLLRQISLATGGRGASCDSIVSQPTPPTNLQTE